MFKTKYNILYVGSCSEGYFSYNATFVPRVGDHTQIMGDEKRVIKVVCSPSKNNLEYYTSSLTGLEIDFIIYLGN
jgi:hypothetical protein